MLFALEIRSDRQGRAGRERERERKKGGERERAEREGVRKGRTFE